MFLGLCVRSQVASRLIAFSRTSIIPANITLLRCSSTATTSDFHKVLPLSSIPPNDLGVSILHLKENGSGSTPTDLMRKGVVIAKVSFLLFPMQPYIKISDVFHRKFSFRRCNDSCFDILLMGSCR